MGELLVSKLWQVAVAGCSADAGAYQRYDDKALASNMLIHACQALSVWREEIGCDGRFMQVNLTATDLADESLVELVEALINGHGLAAELCVWS